MIDVEAEKLLIEQLVQENVEADRDKDLDRIMNLFSEDIAYHVSGFPPIQGKDALRNFVAAGIDQLLDLEMISERTEVAASGDLAFNIGWFKMRNIGMKDFVLFKYVFVLKKVDGVWKIVVDSYSPNSSEGRAF
jgi:uncharacterized protein (TIGR02246 family)